MFKGYREFFKVWRRDDERWKLRSGIDSKSVNKACKMAAFSVIFSLV